MHFFAVQGLNHGLVFEHITGLILSDSDHLDLVLAQVLIHEVHVGDLLRGRLRRQVEVQETREHEDQEPVLKDWRTVRVEVEVLQLLHGAVLLSFFFFLRLPFCLSVFLLSDILFFLLLVFLLSGDLLLLPFTLLLLEELLESLGRTALLSLLVLFAAGEQECLLHALPKKSLPRQTRSVETGWVIQVLDRLLLMLSVYVLLV